MLSRLKTTLIHKNIIWEGATKVISEAQAGILTVGPHMSLYFSLLFFYILLKKHIQAQVMDAGPETWETGAISSKVESLLTSLHWEQLLSPPKSKPK